MIHFSKKGVSTLCVQNTNGLFFIESPWKGCANKSITFKSVLSYYLVIVVCCPGRCESRITNLC